MDTKTLEFLLKQNLNTIIEFTKTMFSTLQQEISDLKSENQVIKQSLQATQSELTEAKLQRNVSPPGNTERLLVGDSGRELLSLSERLRVVEDYTRRNNLVVDGLPEVPSENQESLQVKVSDTFRNKLSVEVGVTAVRRLGKKRSEQGPRPVLVKFNSFQQRQSCMRSSSKLKGTNLFLRDDVCRTTQDIRRTKLDELKAKRSEGLVAYFSGIDIVTKEKKTSPLNSVTSESVDSSIAPSKELRRREDRVLGGEIEADPSSEEGVEPSSTQAVRGRGRGNTRGPGRPRKTATKL